MVASRCASGIDAATTRSLILTLSAKAGVDSESVNAATRSTPRARRKGLFSTPPLPKCGRGGYWACFVRARFSPSDIGKPPSACRPGQAGHARQTPIDNRRGGAVGQYIAGDLIL